MCENRKDAWTYATDQRLKIDTDETSPGALICQRPRIHCGPATPRGADWVGSPGEEEEEEEEEAEAEAEVEEDDDDEDDAEK